MPIIVWVMIGYFESLPHGARGGGADRRRHAVAEPSAIVALPLARPGIVVAAILSFIFSWNNFIFGVVLGGKDTRTLPVAVYNVLTFEQLAWGPLAAAALLVTAAGAARDRPGPAPDRRRADRRRAEGRLT